MIVCKFGGSSVTSLDKLKIIKKIALENKERGIIVVSAIGKANEQDFKMTDLLFELSKLKNKPLSQIQLLSNIETKFLSIIKFCKYLDDFKTEFANFKSNLSTFSDDYIISRGEYFTAKAIASFLGFEFCDSSNFLICNNQRIDVGRSYVKYKKLCIQSGVVIPGFYGEDTNGNIKLLSRGGGDVTGSILTRFSGANLYENYTDVDGVFSINPALVNGAKKIRKLSYVQDYNIAKAGSSVFAKEAITVLATVKTPIKIINLNNGKHTLISSKNCKNFFNLSIKKATYLTIIFNLKNIAKSRFITNILNVFMLDGIEFERVKYINNSLYIVSNKKPLLNKNPLLFKSIYKSYEINKITIFCNKDFCKFKKLLTKNSKLFLTKYCKQRRTIISYYTNHENPLKELI